MSQPTRIILLVCALAYLGPAFSEARLTKLPTPVSITSPIVTAVVKPPITTTTTTTTTSTTPTTSPTLAISPITSTLINPPVTPVSSTTTGTTPTPAGTTSTGSMTVPTATFVSPILSTATQVLATTNPSVTINNLGTLVVSSSASSTTPLTISTSAINNAAIQLPSNQPVAIVAGSSTLTYVDKTGTSQLIVKNSGSSPSIEVGSGQVEIRSTAVGTSLPLASDSSSKPLATLTTATAADTVTITRKNDEAKVFVDSGKINLKGAGVDAVPVFQGEHASLDGNGKLLQINLGSPDGSKGLPGDPLPKAPWVGANTSIPRLDGKLARFDNQKSLLDIVQGAFQEVFGLPGGGVLTYDSTSGVLTLTVGNSSVNLIPVGSPVVPYSFHSSKTSSTASGAFEYASQGIQITLAGALTYFNDFIQAIQNLDAGGKVTLKSNGVLEVTLAGNRYATIPGARASLPDKLATQTPRFEAGADGNILFHDHLGATQLLYPSFTNPEQLAALAGQTIPGATVENPGTGSVTLKAQGRAYTLVPEYSVRALPGNHAGDGYWLENTTFFLNNGDNSAQGFQVR